VHFNDKPFEYKLAGCPAISSSSICLKQQQQQQQQQPFYGPLSGTTRVSRYQKKHSLTHHPDHHPISISFFHLPQSIASSLFKLRAWQSFSATAFHVLFGLPLGLEPFHLIFHTFLHPISVFFSQQNNMAKNSIHLKMSHCTTLFTDFLQTHAS